MSFIDELNRRNVLRVGAAYVFTSWLLIQVAETIFPLFGFDETPARIVVIALAVGFIPTLVLAWVFQVTPQGLRLDRNIDPSQSMPAESTRRFDRAVMIVLALGIGYFAFDKFVLSESRLATAREEGRSEALIESFGIRSIAILPFANRSNKADDAFFVDGIHDDILTELARIGSLRVISRTSVERFRNTQRTIQEIGKLLDVRTILEGGVQRAGDRVRINVQLIEVATDNHLWANIYDRELTTANIFAIQSEVSRAIARSLEATLSPEEEQQLGSVRTGSMAALEAYFLGREAMKSRNTGMLSDAVGHFKRAIELDPNYALAYVALADTYSLQITYSALPSKRQHELAKPLLERALALDDRLGEAYVAKASWEDDVQTREALFKKGLDLAPGYAQGHAWYGDFLMDQGRSDEGLEQLNMAARLDPLSGLVKLELGNYLQRLGRFDQAREQYESIIRIDPEFSRAYQMLGVLELTTYGRLDKAVRWQRQAAAIDPGSPRPPSALVGLWTELGGRAEADFWADRLRQNAEEPLWKDWLSLYLAVRRDGPATAVEIAERIDARAPNRLDAIWVLGLNDLAAGRPDAAIERYRAAYPELLDDAGPIVDDTNWGEAIYLAYCLQAAGDRMKADTLLDRALAQLRTLPRLGRGGYGIMDVFVLTLQGKTKAALTALREAVDAGWREDWRLSLQLSPELASLHEEPEYQAIVAELEADMADQVGRIRQMEARGELAPIPR